MTVCRRALLIDHGGPRAGDCSSGNQEGTAFLGVHSGASGANWSRPEYLVYEAVVLWPLSFMSHSSWASRPRRVPVVIGKSRRCRKQEQEEYHVNINRVSGHVNVIAYIPAKVVKVLGQDLGKTWITCK